MNPRKKSDGLVIENLETELLIYHPGTEEAHCLNSLTAFVWQHCDGNASVEQLAVQASREFNANVSPSEIEAVLATLSAADLLVEKVCLADVAVAADAEHVARSRFIRAAAVATVAAAFSMVSILTPTAEAAMTVT